MADRQAEARQSLAACPAALDARLLQQLAMLLLRHPLAALLDDRSHCDPLENLNVLV